MDQPIDATVKATRCYFLFTLEIAAAIGEHEGTVKINALTISENNYVRDIDIKRASDSAMIQFMKSLPKEQALQCKIQKCVILGMSFLGEMTPEQFAEVDPVIPPTAAELEQVTTDA